MTKLEMLRAAVVAAVIFGCADADDGKLSGYTYCAGDSDCPSGQVCDLDDTKDAYCTPACAEDEVCPTQVSCPSLEPVGKKCWITQTPSGEDRGVCDQFQGYYGPNSCRDAEESDDSCIPNGDACGPSATYVDACCSGYCGEHGTCSTD